MQRSAAPCLQAVCKLCDCLSELNAWASAPMSLAPPAGELRQLRPGLCRWLNRAPHSCNWPMQETQQGTTLQLDHICSRAEM